MDEGRFNFGTHNNMNDNMGDNERPIEEDIAQNNLAQIQARNRKNRALVAYVMCLVAQLFCLLSQSSRSTQLTRQLESCDEDSHMVRQELMNHLTKTERCRDIIRMSPIPFARLCDLLRRTHRLKDSVNSTIEEHVGRFLHIISHNETNRNEQFFFRRSDETISRHFHDVLKAIFSLEDIFLNQPTGAEVPQQIMFNNRYFSYFKDCIGAIDGTHVRVKVSATNAARYRGRKNWPTQNVLAACSFDLKFTYVMSGWEETASDSRIIKSALTREDGLKIPNGKYYLADGGFMLKHNLLTPYRGVRYHLKEYSQRGPENKEELFNNRHSSLRNVIERAFGVVKKRFPIIAGGAEAHYSVDTMSRIIIVCCILHNFVMTVDPNDGLINEVDRELLNSGPPDDNGSDGHSDDNDASIAAMLRENCVRNVEQLCVVMY